MRPHSAGESPEQVMTIVRVCWGEDTKLGTDVGQWPIGHGQVVDPREVGAAFATPDNLSSHQFGRSGPGQDPLLGFDLV